MAGLPATGKAAAWDGLATGAAFGKGALEGYVVAVPTPPLGTVPTAGGVWSPATGTDPGCNWGFGGTPAFYTNPVAGGGNGTGATADAAI